MPAMTEPLAASTATTCVPKTPVTPGEDEGPAKERGDAEAAAERFAKICFL
jgi:hypothetical protein